MQQLPFPRLTMVKDVQICGYQFQQSLLWDFGFETVHLLSIIKHTLIKRSPFITHARRYRKVKRKEQQEQRWQLRCTHVWLQRSGNSCGKTTSTTVNGAQVSRGHPASRCSLKQKFAIHFSLSCIFFEGYLLRTHLKLHFKCTFIQKWIHTHLCLYTRLAKFKVPTSRCKVTWRITTHKVVVDLKHVNEREKMCETFGGHLQNNQIFQTPICVCSVFTCSKILRYLRVAWSIKSRTVHPVLQGTTTEVSPKVTVTFIVIGNLRPGRFPQFLKRRWKVPGAVPEAKAPVRRNLSSRCSRSGNQGDVAASSFPS